MVVSRRFNLRREDFDKAIFNAKVFAAPLLVIYFYFVIGNVKVDGFAWSDFSPNNAVIATGVLYVLNFCTDIFKKWTGRKVYK